MKINIKIYLAVFLSLSFGLFQAQAQKQEKFKVMLDAGHGGNDPGAIGHGVKEKDVVLAVVLKVGKLLEKHKDIEVAYTRKTDIFIPVKDRSTIANKAKASVFVSVHCNSHKNSSPYGTETFVMGISKNKSNMEVAKRENSVIFLEDDYKSKYQGYDPNNPESMVAMMLLQGEYINQSISLASAIQNNFTHKLKRHNRGVKQDIFYVLHGCAMPSVLTELGFVSNKNEAEYLKSEKGQNELAQAIANALISYKNDHYSSSSEAMDLGLISLENTKNSTPQITEVVENTKTTVTETINKNETIFKVQIAASSNKLELKPSNFNGLSPVTFVKDGSLYKYQFGETNSYQTAQELLQQAKSKGYEQAFIVAFKDGQQVKLSDIIK